MNQRLSNSSALPSSSSGWGLVAKRRVGTPALFVSAVLGGLVGAACGGETDTGTASNPIVGSTTTTPAPVTPPTVALSTTSPAIPPPVGDFPQNPPPNVPPTNPLTPPVEPNVSPPVVIPTATPTNGAVTSPPVSTTTEPAPSTTEPGVTSELTSQPGGETTSDEPTTNPPTGNGQVLLSEDFESDAVGAVPEGYDTFIGWVANPTSPSGSEVVAVGDGQKHGGTKALQIKSGTNPAQLVWKIPSGHDKLYVRTWLYLADRQLGQNPGANHETLIALRDSVGSANSEIRFGEIKGVIGTNEVPTDDISPLLDQWGKGPVIAKGKWVCLEVAFLGDLPYHELHAWADGELVHEVTAADQWQNTSLKASNWMEGRFIELVFGWHSFSSASNTLWFDDIVVSTERVGCQ